MQYWNQLRVAINALKPDDAEARRTLKETFEAYDKDIQALIRTKQPRPKFCILQ